MRKNPLVLPDYRAYCEVIADLYDALPEHNEAEEWRWALLIDSVKKFWRKMKRQVDVEFVPGQPYDNAEHMKDEVERTGVLYVSTDANEHPLWTPEENLQFRAVHDYIVHILGDSDFSRRGEIRAYNLHRRLTPRDAWPALFTEVVGQACFANARGEFPVQKIAVFDDVDLYDVGVVQGSPVLREPRGDDREMIPPAHKRSGKARKNPAHPEALEAYMQEYIEQTEAYDRGMRFYGDVILDVKPFDGDIHIGWVMSTAPHSGAGHRAMRFLTDLADKHGVKLTLDAMTSPVMRPRETDLTTPQLVVFYQKHGFDFEDDEIAEMAAAENYEDPYNDGYPMRRAPKKQRTRKNPLEPFPTFVGSPAWGGTEGGVHTADTIEAAAAYAQLKARTGGTGEDYPVVLVLKPRGKKAKTDIDVLRAAELAAEYAAEYDNPEEFLDSTDEWVNPVADFQAGDSTQSWLFARTVPSGDYKMMLRLSEFLEEQIESGGDADQAYNDVKAGNLTDAEKIHIWGQRRYMDPVDEVVGVYYLPPFQAVIFEDPMHAEDSEEAEREIQNVIDKGFEVVTDAELDTYDVAASKELVWGEDKGRTQYHGTSYRNVIKAFPWLKDELPKPPRPFFTTADLREELVELAMAAHEDKTEEEIREKVRDLDRDELWKWIDQYESEEEAA